jgi:hypothetical protein
MACSWRVGDDGRSVVLATTNGPWAGRVLFRVPDAVPGHEALRLCRMACRAPAVPALRHALAAALPLVRGAQEMRYSLRAGELNEGRLAELADAMEVALEAGGA